MVGIVFGRSLFRTYCRQQELTRFRDTLLQRRPGSEFKPTRYPIWRRLAEQKPAAQNQFPKRARLRARALAASSSRLRGGAWV